MALKSQPNADQKTYPTLRPKDAATLILIDRSTNKPRALMGKRSTKHVFMPDLFVFPGGRRDRNDWRLPVHAPLRQSVVNGLLLETHKRFTSTTAQALALAAARELHEETGLDLSKDKDGFDLSSFRYFARAVTPIGQSRRFDTRFFVCFCDEITFDHNVLEDSHELLDLRWVAISDPSGSPLPDITRTILSQLDKTLDKDNDLSFSAPIISYNGHSNHYFMKSND